MSAELHQGAAGQMAVIGEINAKTALTLLAQSKPHFVGNGALTVDLAGVTRSDSTGVALLLEWMRMAGTSDREIHFANIPPQMSAIAEVCGVSDLLS